jgi:hypothetical protein
MAKQPKILTRLKRQLRDSTRMRGKKLHKTAVKYLVKCGNLKSDGTATAKGTARGNMTARERAADRARKYARGTNVTNSRR